MIDALKKRVLRVGISSIFVGMIIVISTMLNGSSVFAATGPQGACGSSITVDNTPAGASASCTMGITSTFNNGTLSFTNDANATTSPAVVGTNNFSFNTTVIDQRNTNAGWRLEASSAGLQNSANGATTTLPLNFTGSSATCTPTVSGQPTCTTTTGYPITLSTTSQYFLSSNQPTAPAIISGTYSAHTTGTFVFTGGEPAGTYSGSITIALVNAF